MIAGAIAAKADNEQMLNIQEMEGSDDKSDELKQSQIIVSDSIQNYKTVASFGNDRILLAEYDRMNALVVKNEEKSSRIQAISLSLSYAL